MDVYKKRNERRKEQQRVRKQNQDQLKADRKATDQAFRITNPKGYAELNRHRVNWKGWLALAVVAAFFVAGVLYIRSGAFHG